MDTSTYKTKKKINHRHFIYISIIIFLLTLIIINFNDLALRFYYTFKTLFNNLYYYFQVVVNEDVNELIYYASTLVLSLGFGIIAIVFLELKRKKKI